MQESGSGQVGGSASKYGFNLNPTHLFVGLELSTCNPTQTLNFWDRFRLSLPALIVIHVFGGFSSEGNPFFCARGSRRNMNYIGLRCQLSYNKDVSCSALY
eukprot:TRINITY_DN22716_c0_g3_i1.p1 TRINITY_DN22716_c0_g3~~TRINITY_DN22716_c0_g3_i1.p1  ORF type:complete len:101 (-),score=6.91 TRINITY_DN22716_c0_g3_i1:193-495(-)